ncbi:hypothetical protein BDN72DRAFT_837304 [Pluteus cervinus]|uniref:Uncharacterized protein n=1 Tax=Pluteus cervinus TaxID=181527 RepID=A0ACD3B425_9AGAR|nr:hypothetical protein BDN72DRAFT_837304 [Pluteus cervinus]
MLPDGICGIQHHKPLKTAYLLEIDQRFSVLSPRTYFPYDMNQPTVLPKDLLGRVDLAIVDPAFLNEDTNTKIVTSLKQLLKPDTGRTVLITSTSIESILKKVYDTPPVGPIRRTAFQIEHTQLQNDFAVWGSWDGAENFGANKTS